MAANWKTLWAKRKKFWKIFRNPWQRARFRYHRQSQKPLLKNTALDLGQIVKEPCTYCQTNFGYDYYIQPSNPKSTYFKKGRFDDESECA